MNASIFDPVQTVQFLTLCTYMNKLSNLFYDEQLIKEEDRNETFTIVNTFYEYLDRSKNETELKEQIIRKLLEGSDLYGGQENETLDIEYVNRTFDYIISNAVFSQSGNIFGYLAEIVSTSESLKLSAFKQTAFERLSYLRNLNDDGDVSNLTQLAIGKIAEDLLWPLLPNATRDMDVVSVKYLYSLAGHKLSQSAQMNMSEVSFQKYATLAMAMEASVIGDELPKSVLQIFALPALFYYAHKERANITQYPMKQLIKDEDFWSNAFFTFFTFLSSTFETIRQEALATNSLYQFHLEMSKFKNRTAVARDVLHKQCSNLNATYLESLIDGYKTYSSSSRCHKLAKLLPNLELVYEAQFYSIKEKYRLMELDLIRSAFDQFPHIRDLINSTDAIVHKSYPIGDFVCYMCVIVPPDNKPNVHLFGILHKDQVEYFALEQNENNVTLLLQKDGKEDFNKRVGLPFGTDLEIYIQAPQFKESKKDFNFFIEKFAEQRADEFKKQLFNYGYDKTSMEKFFDILKAFVPFYNCVEYAMNGEHDIAAFSCTGDVVALIPLAGIFSIGFKISSLTINRFLTTAELSLRTYTFRQAILATTIGLRRVAIDLSGTFIKVVFTKEMFRKLSVAVIRTLDPGFELVGKLTISGSAFIGKIINNAFKRLSKNFPTLNFKYAKFETIWLHLTGQGAKSADVKIVPVPGTQIEGREAFRFIYPGGTKPYGPKYIQLSRGYAELRHLIGFEKEIPVVTSRVSKRGKVFYRRINLQTEEPFGLELKLNKYTKLENVEQPFRQHIFKLKTEGLGGLGALATRRSESIREACQLIATSQIGVTRQAAMREMKHYILLTDSPTTAEDLMKIELSNFGTFKRDEFHNVLETYKTNAGDETDLTLYLSTPTYAVFALDWIRNVRISPMYNKYYVRDTKTMEHLLFGNKKTESTNMSRKKIADLYGQKYFLERNELIENAVQNYFRDMSRKAYDFQDYYAVYAWRHRKYESLPKNSIDTKRLQESLYRLAVRGSTDEFRRKVLYHFDIKDLLPINTDLSKIIGETVSTKGFILSVGDESSLLERFLDFPKRISDDNMQQIFLYKSNIDTNCLTVDLYGVMSMQNPVTVILPDIKFKIINVERKIIYGYNVVFLELVNVPTQKEIMIAKYMSKIHGM